MGGLALKNCVTRRYDAEEYFEISDEVVSWLKYWFPRCDVSVIKSYRNKPSHGDLDVLITSDELPTDWVKTIKSTFGPMEMVKNGNVLSFEYCQFQIDLIATPRSEFVTSQNYFAYNDLGNLLGRLSNSLGLKLGHDGLSYTWKDNTYQFKNEIISTNWKEICNVLGVSYKRYCEGFDELEDIFKFVVASPFFNKDIYLLHNRNNYARTRDKKRKTYTEFLKWIENYEETPTQQGNAALRDHVEDYRKAVWLPYLFTAIKGFEETYNRVQVEWAAETEFKKRYNGEIVSEITGLQRNELGAFMKWMKETHEQTRMKKDIVKLNPVLVSRWIEYWFGKYKEQYGV